MRDFGHKLRIILTGLCASVAVAFFAFRIFMWAFNFYLKNY